MTREEAAEVLELLYGDCDPIEENTWLALRMGVAALRGSQPDPDTGLMPCGWCCPERIGWFRWNRAMGWREGNEN